MTTEKKPSALTVQRRLMAIAQDIMGDVKEAGDDLELLTYSIRRATRRLRVLAGKPNLDVDALSALAERARIKEVHELAGLLDETQLSAAG